MRPRPVFEDPCYTGSCKLKGKTALITGGDSGIGRAAAIAFAKEGANLAIVYLNENEDAKETKKRIEELGQECILPVSYTHLYERICEEQCGCDGGGHMDGTGREAFQKLYEYRIRRAPLHKDDKILVSWNGWMICAYAKAGAVLGDRCV